VLVVGLLERQLARSSCRRYKPKTESVLDRPYSLILCAVVTTLAQVVNMDDEADVAKRQSAQHAYGVCLHTRTLSQDQCYLGTFCFYIQVQCSGCSS
jgi:hypothetical protein